MIPQGGPFECVASKTALAHSLGVSLAVFNRFASECALDKSEYLERRLLIRGHYRVINIPNPALKTLQKRIAWFLSPLNDELSDLCHGYVPTRSTRTNARAHCGASWVQKFDIQEFFPRTTSSRVSSAFVAWGCESEEVADELAAVCTYRNSLPLGSPSSPIISNLILAELDSVLDEIAINRGLICTRYADDITFSGGDRFDVEQMVQRAVSNMGYQLNSGKTSLMRRGQAIRVTGLTISEPDRPRIPKKFKRQLRSELFHIYTFGLEAHASVASRALYLDPESDDVPEVIRRQVLGRLLYAFSVEPEWCVALFCRYPGIADIVGWSFNAKRRVEFRKKLLKSIRDRSSASLTHEPTMFLEDGSPRNLFVEAGNSKSSRRLRYVGRKL